MLCPWKREQWFLASLLGSICIKKLCLFFQAVFFLGADLKVQKMVFTLGNINKEYLAVFFLFLLFFFCFLFRVSPSFLCFLLSLFKQKRRRFVGEIYQKKAMLKKFRQKGWSSHHQIYRNKKKKSQSQVAFWF